MVLKVDTSVNNSCRFIILILVSARSDRFLVSLDTLCLKNVVVQKKIIPVSINKSENYSFRFIILNCKCQVDQFLVTSGILA